MSVFKNNYWLAIFPMNSYTKIANEYNNELTKILSSSNIIFFIFFNVMLVECTVNYSFHLYSIFSFLMSTGGSSGSGARPWWGACDDAAEPKSSGLSAKHCLHRRFIYHHNQQTAHEPSQLHWPCWGKASLTHLSKHISVFSFY